MLECLEDQEAYKTAVAAWDEFEKSGRKSVPAEDVFAKAGL